MHIDLDYVKAVVGNGVEQAGMEQKSRNLNSEHLCFSQAYVLAKSTLLFSQPNSKHAYSLLFDAAVDPVTLRTL